MKYLKSMQKPMKLISIIIVFLFNTSLINGQCYYKKDSLYSDSLKEIELTRDIEETNIEKFFKIDIEFWELNNTDNFCYQISTSTTSDAKFLLGQGLLDYLEKGDMSRMPTYGHLLSYYFQDKLNVKNNLTERELLADMLAGYYYCYQKITLNWNEINSSVSSLIKTSEELNLAMDDYIQMHNEFIIDSNEQSVDIVARKSAFLKGTYYAMPPNYRMHITSKINFGNDVALLFNEIKKDEISKRDVFKSSTRLTLEDIKFEIKERKD